MSARSNSSWCFAYQGQGEEKYFSLVSIQMGQGEEKLFILADLLCFNEFKLNHCIYCHSSRQKITKISFKKNRFHLDYQEV